MKKTKSKSKSKIAIVILLALSMIGLFGVVAYAAPGDVQIPNVDISIGGEGDGTPQSYVENIRLLVLLTVLSVLPSLIIMVTSFTRIIVIFSFLKSALGASQSIPRDQKSVV